MGTPFRRRNLVLCTSVNSVYSSRHFYNQPQPPQETNFPQTDEEGNVAYGDRVGDVTCSDFDHRYPCTWLNASSKLQRRISSNKKYKQTTSHSRHSSPSKSFRNNLSLLPARTRVFRMDGRDRIVG